VAALGAAPAAREALNGAIERAASAHPEWHFVGFADWRALARLAARLWPGRDGIEPLLTLASVRRVGPDPVGAAGRGRCVR